MANPEPTTGFEIPSKMRAVTLDGAGFDHLKIESIPTPRPGPRQLLARVDAAGICTSLIKLIEQGSAHKFVYGWDITQFPLILGDEGAVTLVEVGEELSQQYSVGERYVIQPAVEHAPINHIERYREHARGVDKVAVGYSLAGHLAEYILVPEEILEAKCLLPLPDPNMPYAHASLGEPISCVVSAQDHHVHLVQDTPLSPRNVVKGLKPGGVVVIVGAGAMGRMHVDLALSYHPTALIVTDFIDDRLDIVRRLFGAKAEQLGIALHTVNPSKTDFKALLAQVTHDRGADDVIVAVGSGRAIEGAQYYTARGAVLDLFGGLKKGEEMISLATDIVHYQEINITGSSGGSPWDIARTLDMMSKAEITASAHITRIGDLEHAPELLAQVKAQTLDGKAIVYPHRRTANILSVPSWNAADEQSYLSTTGA